MQVDFELIINKELLKNYGKTFNSDLETYVTVAVHCDYDEANNEARICDIELDFDQVEEAYKVVHLAFNSSRYEFKKFIFDFQYHLDDKIIDKARENEERRY